eukprot:3377293-Rhodomonas_salina.2
MNYKTPDSCVKRGLSRLISGPKKAVCMLISGRKKAVCMLLYHDIVVQVARAVGACIRDLSTGHRVARS